MAYSVASPLDLPADMEMFQRPKTESVFFSRPASTYTDFFDIDPAELDIDDGSSDFEEDSPRPSFDSLGQHSSTTVTSYDPVTPAVDRRNAFDVQLQRASVVQGPSGPHLFRFSSASLSELESALQLSPVVAKLPPSILAATARSPISSNTTPKPGHSFFQLPYRPTDFRSIDIEHWTTQHVAAWMCSKGFDDATISKFEAHDIDGLVILELKFEDLRELDIASFGKRQKLWHEICELTSNGSASPVHTPIADDINKPLARSVFGSRRQHNGLIDDIVSPQESISIVAIEQLIPKPHKCAKGEKCPKYKQRERLLRRIEQDHPLSPTMGGHFVVAGDPGNPLTAPRISHDELAAATMAAQSDVGVASIVVPSVVASSDVLGPGQMPEVALQEEALRNVQKRDPQENVKQFLTFQHLAPSHTPDDTPPSPPAETPRYEMFPAPAQIQASTNYYQTIPAVRPALPKLSIPVPPERSTSATANPSRAFSPLTISNNNLPHRFGTPASEADAPTHLFLSPTSLPTLARETSQSVPPNMQFRAPVRRRPDSRTAHLHQRSSLALEPVTEETPISTSAQTTHPLPETFPSSSDPTPRPSLTSSCTSSGGGACYFTNCTASTCPRHALRNASRTSLPAHVRYGSATTHAGWMRKRRQRLLRHEWSTAHFRLQGSQLALHATADAADRRALEVIDVDDYAVACSSLASNSKFAAALKTLKIGAGGKDRGLDDSAFLFQLVPTAVERAGRLKIAEARLKQAAGGTHHFAVRTGDERIDWMREIMLAKAVKAKGEGKSVVVNGKEI